MFALRRINTCSLAITVAARGDALLDHHRGGGDAANTIGLPRYAKQAVDQQFSRWVMLHVQSNPLPICTRPRVLIKGKRT
jgi:Phage major capsid protein E